MEDDGDESVNVEPLGFWSPRPDWLSQATLTRSQLAL